MATRLALTRSLGGYAAAAVGTALPWPLLLVLAWDEWGAVAVGLVAAARMAPYVLLSWAVGTLGDRVRRDRLLLGTLLLRFVLLSGAAVAVATDDLLVAVVLASLAVACGTPAYPALVAAVPELAGSRRERATDALVTIEVAAWVVGPALGGLLLVPMARPWVPGVAVALLGVSLLVTAGVRLPSPPERQRSSACVGGMLRTVRADRTVLAALGVAGLVNVVDSGCAVALLPLTRESWGQDDGGFGMATAWLGFGALGAPLLWWVPGPADRRRRRALAALGLLLAGVGLAAGPTVALPLLAIAGAVSVLVESSVTQTLQDAVEDGQRAGVLGLADSVMVLGALLGSLVAPLLAASLGARPTFVVAALACAVTAAVASRRGAHRPAQTSAASSMAATTSSEATSSAPINPVDHGAAGLSPARLR